MKRTEFGVERSTCSCMGCVINCYFLPGFLIPSDLERMIPSDQDPFKWACEHLEASPGALVAYRNKRMRIGTLVPKTAGDGLLHCHWLDTDAKTCQCKIHENSPFGCAFFMHDSEDKGLSKKGLTKIIIDRDENGLYSKLWDHLVSKGLITMPPEYKRALMDQFLESVAKKMKG